MPHRLSLSESLGWLLVLGLATPATAHQVQTARDVGGTLHIEPNDNPQAGKPALTWFALTRRGGQIIPVQACRCQLAVYAKPRTGTPLLTPQLEPVNVQQYQGVPGAAIAFPKAGAYELVLRGSPKLSADFQPFELKFAVTVTGAAATAGPQAVSTGRALPAFLVPALVIASGVVWLIVRRSKLKR